MNKTTFTENLENNQLIAVRKFNASIEKIRKAWGHKEFLCQWWAPAPYVCEILEMEFKQGGHWMYTMTGPEGDTYMGRMDYLTIREFEMIEAEEYFCDENGEKLGEVPPMHQKFEFESGDEITIITMTTTYASPEALQQMAEMGAAEGWELACNQLDELLTTL